MFPSNEQQLLHMVTIGFWIDCRSLFTFMRAFEAISGVNTLSAVAKDEGFMPQMNIDGKFLRHMQRVCSEKAPRPRKPRSLVASDWSTEMCKKEVALACCIQHQVVVILGSSCMEGFVTNAGSARLSFFAKLVVDGGSTICSRQQIISMVCCILVDRNSGREQES